MMLTAGKTSNTPIKSFMLVKKWLQNLGSPFYNLWEPVKGVHYYNRLFQNWLSQPIRDASFPEFAGIPAFMKSKFLLLNFQLILEAFSPDSHTFPPDFFRPTCISDQMCLCVIAFTITHWSKTINNQVWYYHTHCVFLSLFTSCPFAYLVVNFLYK